MRGNNDPHGYGELYSELKEIKAYCEVHFQCEECMSLLDDAMSYYGVGSPTEFLGESRIALSGLLKHQHKIDGSYCSRIENVIRNINRGFKLR
ncbi:hypothetical protein FE236_08350 [Mariprofundus erugo]|uniref:hypothetical protein n=1 Tax=Mariprofundus erugo TaxID=2528639 RepID=UPI0010FEFD72|nr:hypothetical protein [Mariprofundus erugo]TLS75749.1 hypothetical protein FE236_08350 [Mariprofundus erugo]